MFSAASVCLFVRTITSERLNVGRSNLAVRLGVHCTKISPEFKGRGQKTKIKVTRDKNNEKLLSHPHWQCTVRPAPYGGTQQAATGDTIARPLGVDRLRRWENQRMRSSGLQCFFRAAAVTCDACKVCYDTYPCLRLFVHLHAGILHTETAEPIIKLPGDHLINGAMYKWDRNDFRAVSVAVIFTAHILNTIYCDFWCMSVHGQ